MGKGHTASTKSLRKVINTMTVLFNSSLLMGSDTQRQEFTRQVKLEPFLRAMEQQNPDVTYRENTGTRKSTKRKYKKKKKKKKNEKKIDNRVPEYE